MATKPIDVRLTPLGPQKSDENTKVVAGKKGQGKEDFSGEKVSGDKAGCDKLSGEKVSGEKVSGEKLCGEDGQVEIQKVTGIFGGSFRYTDQLKKG